MSQQHCILFWHGLGSKLEMWPRIVSIEKTKNFLEDVVIVLDKMSIEGWKLRHISSSKGQTQYTFSRKVKNLPESLGKKKLGNITPTITPTSKQKIKKF